MNFFEEKEENKFYDIYNTERLNKNRKNIIVFLLENSLSKDMYVITYRYIFNTLKILAEDHNILIVSKGSGATQFLKHFQHHFEFGKYAYIIFDKKKKFGLSAQEFTHNERIEYFKNTFLEMEEKDSWIFQNLAGTISSQFLVPSQDTNFEIIPTTEKEKEKMNHAVEKYLSAMEKYLLVSHTAFIHKPLSFGVEFLFHLMQNYKNTFHYGFCHDTSSSWVHLVKNPWEASTKCFYFVDDDRGVRSFKKFPMTEMQDFFGKKFPSHEDYNKILLNKKEDFVFGGLFPFEVEYRIDAWYKFFHDLRVDGKIRTQTNGKPKIITNKDSLSKITEKTKLPKKFDKKRKEIEKFANDIISHPMVCSTIPYDEFNDGLKDYLFTIILKCYYGKFDSLNFRVINSLFFGTIPLIDKDYDVGNLQIPIDLRKKIEVSNHHDIQEKIDYYKKNQREYVELFFELLNHFIDRSYFNEEIVKKRIKEYFGELYK